MLAPVSRQQTIEEQEAAISALQKKFKDYVANGAHIIQYDACCFSANSYSKFQWAPSGRPLLTRQRYITSNVVCVYGFISVNLGEVMIYIEEKVAFNKEDFGKLIISLGRRKELQDDKVVLFGDNSTLHNNHFVTEVASDEQFEMLFNIPYRPDLNGIEGLWRHAKSIYKTEVARLHTGQQKVNNLEVVKWVFQ